MDFDASGEARTRLDAGGGRSRCIVVTHAERENLWGLSAVRGGVGERGNAIGGGDLSRGPVAAPLARQGDAALYNVRSWGEQCRCRVFRRVFVPRTPPLLDVHLSHAGRTPLIAGSNGQRCSGQRLGQTRARRQNRRANELHCRARRAVAVVGSPRLSAGTLRGNCVIALSPTQGTARRFVTHLASPQ